MQSLVSVPLLVHDQLTGTLNLAANSRSAFRPEHIDIAAEVADQIAVMLQQARLREQVQRHTAELEIRVAERTRELSLANEQLKELDRAKDQFVSNVSHELRTPLANLKLYLALLDRGKPEKRAESMQTLQREQQRLDKMIEDLLDLSRLDLGVTPIRLIPTDLNLLLSQLIADRAALVAEHQLVLDYQPDDNLPLALIDPVMLTEVITNLVGNAINYTPSGGLISVSTTVQQRKGHDWVTFTVQDNGPGISANDLSHLFERFYRGEVGRKASAPGTGLGLAISKEIVEKMGGRITAESEPNHGATFTVWLRPAD
jgi:signal transduction histidine kinase